MLRFCFCYIVVCKQLVEQENTVLFCHNNTATDTINCTLNCQPGFAFDHDPKDYYFCGPETLHEWDFQTNENPLARLPSCTGMSYITFVSTFPCGNRIILHLTLHVLAIGK